MGLLRVFLLIMACEDSMGVRQLRFGAVAFC